MALSIITIITRRDRIALMSHRSRHILYLLNVPLIIIIFYLLQLYVSVVSGEGGICSPETNGCTDITIDLITIYRMEKIKSLKKQTKAIVKTVKINTHPNLHCTRQFQCEYQNPAGVKNYSKIALRILLNTIINKKRTRFALCNNYLQSCLSFVFLNKINSPSPRTMIIALIIFLYDFIINYYDCYSLIREIYLLINGFSILILITFTHNLFIIYS